MRSIGMLLLVVAILLAGLWFAGERGLVSFPYPPTRPWLREHVTITVVEFHHQCVIVDAPPRLITKPGRTVTWKIRAQGECAAHDVIVKFDGESEKKAKATDGSEITLTIPTARQEKPFIYEILLASQPVVMARGTLAACPEWPCKAAKANAADATFTTDTGGPVVPTTTLTPVTTIPGSPAQANTPPPQ
jgi:hypothetical protein